MRRLALLAAVLLLPGGLPIGLAVWTYRRIRASNRITVVKAPCCPILRVMKGGKA